MTGKLNVVAREPVLVAALASILTFIGAKYGVNVDPAQASEAAGVVLLLGSAYARQLVRPTVKDDDPVTTPVLDQVVKEVLARNVPTPPDPAKPPVP